MEANACTSLNEISMIKKIHGTLNQTSRFDTVRNPKEFPHAFLEGSWEGFWWAFITMTTVGYGDKAPKSLPARLFGIFWILIGLVIISTFTATITTVLTATSLTSESKLYGTKVGALDNSEEYRLGVKRNADVIGYSSVPEVIDALNQGIIQGALIDTYIAGEFQGELSGYRMEQVLEHVFVYGVALSRDATALQKCFDTYIETQQSDLFTTISKVVKLPKEKNSANQHVQSSATLFDSNTPFFKQVVICGACMLAALLLFGFLWDILYWRRKKKILIRIFSKPLDNGAKVKNRFKPGEIVEYQRKSFKNDICEIKEQIEQFSACWVKKLDSMDAQFQDQLEQVHQWLEKAVLSQEDTLPSSKDFTHSVSVDHQKQLQKGSFDEMEWDSQGLTVINSTKEVFSLMDKLSEARLTNLWSNGNTQV